MIPSSRTDLKQNSPLAWIILAKFFAFLHEIRVLLSRISQISIYLNFCLDVYCYLSTLFLSIFTGTEFSGSRSECSLSTWSKK